MDYQTYRNRLAKSKKALRGWETSIEEEEGLLEEEDSVEARLKAHNNHTQYTDDLRSCKLERQEWQYRRNNLPSDQRITKEIKELCEPITAACRSRQEEPDKAIHDFYFEGDFWLTSPDNGANLPSDQQTDEIKSALALISLLYSASHKFSPVFDPPITQIGVDE